MNKVAFLTGYLHKEAAIDWFAGGNYNPLNWGADAGNKIDEAKKWTGDKATAMGQGMEAVTEFIGSDNKAQNIYELSGMQAKEDSIRAQADTAIKGARKEIGDAFVKSTGANMLTTLGTGMLGQMSANGRHKEMMKAIRGMGGSKAPAVKSQVFRLSHPGQGGRRTPAAAARAGQGGY
jgi:uncharacterized protein with von Willebrand factor type A (vWA) domain